MIYSDNGNPIVGVLYIHTVGEADIFCDLHEEEFTLDGVRYVIDNNACLTVDMNTVERFRDIDWVSLEAKIEEKFSGIFTHIYAW